MTIRFYFLPVDRSLQAFKEWMQSYHLKPDAKDMVATKQWIDEEQWIENWKKFWAKVDNASRSRGSSGDR